MKSIYQKFCREQLDSSGALAKIELDYPENFNFGYDVVDAIAESEPEKRRLFGAIQRMKNIFLRFPISRNSAIRLPMYWKPQGSQEALGSW